MAETTRTQPPRFSQEEAAEIIRDATEVSLRGRGAELTREDIVEMAKELGLDEASVERALQLRQHRAAKATFRRRALIALASHLSTYVTVIGGLVIIDIVTGPPAWAYWPAIGWGIGVASHTFGTLIALIKGEEPPTKGQGRDERRARREARRLER